MTWLPDDAELDAVARTSPTATTDAARAEDARTSLLAAAAGRAQLSRRSRVPYVAIGGALAAAAAVIVWIGVRPTPQAPSDAPGVAIAGKRQAIMAMGKATFHRASEWPDFVVRLDDGRIMLEVATVQSGERFRVVTTDAEVEVRGTKFEVAADRGHIAEVAVQEGRVEVRAQGRVIVLAAGEVWSAPRTAQLDILSGSDAAPTVATAEPTASAEPGHATDTSHVPAAKQVAADHVDATKPTPDPARHVAKRVETNPTTDAKHVDTKRTTDAKRVDTKPTTDAAKHVDAHPADAKHANTTDVDTAPKPHAEATKPDVVVNAEPPKPGEDEFRAGWTALRGGDASAATKLFATACARAASDTLGEDACFWAGAAAKRANDTSTARTSLVRFLDRFPHSARAAEASALLGWILYDAGELDAAEQRFKLAAGDRVPKVRDSALKGLEAISRKRAQ